jgi:hypothetical protein
VPQELQAWLDFKNQDIPYLNQQKHLFLPIIAYTLSSTKLEIRAK